MNIPQAELDVLLAIMNYLLVGGIKDLASWAHVTIESRRTVLLAGLISAALVAATTIYGNHEELSVASFLHWVIVYAGSVGIYRGLTQVGLGAGVDLPPLPVIPTRLNEVRAAREAKAVEVKPPAVETHL